MYDLWDKLTALQKKLDEVKDSLVDVAVAAGDATMDHVKDMAETAHDHYESMKKSVAKHLDDLRSKID